MVTKHNYYYISRKIEIIIKEILRVENIGVDINTPRIEIYYKIYEKHSPRKTFNEYLLFTMLEVPKNISEEVTINADKVRISIYDLIHKHEYNITELFQYFSESQYSDLLRKIKEVQPALFNLVYFHDVLIMLANDDMKTINAIGDVTGFVRRFMKYANDVTKNMSKYIKKT